MTEGRRVHRIVVDVLATEAQVHALHTVLGEALCAVPYDHDGPCRIAWSIHTVSRSDDQDDENDDLDAETERRIRRDLEPIEVWPAEDVDRSLGLG